MDTAQLDAFRAHVEALGYEFFAMSAATHQGTRELVQHIARRLSELPPVTVYEPGYVPKPPVIGAPPRPLHILEREDNTWLVEVPWLQRLMGNINFSDYEDRMYFDKMLRQGGLFDALEQMEHSGRRHCQYVRPGIRVSEMNIQRPADARGAVFSTFIQKAAGREFVWMSAAACFSWRRSRISRRWSWVCISGDRA